MSELNPVSHESQASFGAALPTIFATMAAAIEGPDGGPWEAVHPAPPPAMGNGCPAYLSKTAYDPRAAFEWIYQDESGAPLFRSVRAPEKRFWQSPADGHGGWVKPCGGWAGCALSRTACRNCLRASATAA
jgi:hypothetical protein